MHKIENPANKWEEKKNGTITHDKELTISVNKHKKLKE